MSTVSALDVARGLEESLRHLWQAQDELLGVPYEKTSWAFVVKDDTGRVMGGVGGYFCWGWSYVSTIIVEPAARKKGHGAALMAKAEDHARRQGMKGLHLKTMNVQAPEFYTKLGFEKVGEIADMPPGKSLLYMVKRF